MAIKILETRNCDIVAELNYDVQQLHTKIEPEIFKKYSKEDMKILFENSLKCKEVKLLVAYFEDKPAGYVMVDKVDYSETEFRYAYSVLYVEQICVSSKFLNKGIGKCLINEVKNIAKEQGIKRIELDYWDKNLNAGEFFRSQGFNTFNQKLFCEI